MNGGQLNKYCDEVLRILNSNGNKDPLLFGVGEFRKEQKIPDDLFVKIRLSEDDTKTIIRTLEDLHYVKTETRERSSYYDLGNKENVNSAIFAVSLTDEGRYFVQTSSFTKEARWKILNKWFPNIPNIVGISAVFISSIACVIAITDAQQKKNAIAKQKAETAKQLNELEKRVNNRMDSLATLPATDRATKW